MGGVRGNELDGALGGPLLSSICEVDRMRSWTKSIGEGPVDGPVDRHADRWGRLVARKIEARKHFNVNITGKLAF